jgi:tripartite ATP-independent transporter DctM subunit
MVPTAWTEMKRFGYSPSLGLGTIAAGGTLGMLIPPSLSFVVYAMIAEQSVCKLLIAGILPGFLLAGLMMFTIYMQVRLNPSLAPGTASATWKERWSHIGGIWPMVFLGVVIMGTIWGGVLTPEEAGAFGALIAFLMAVIRKRFTRENLKQCFLNTARTTAMVFTIMIGATIFSGFVTITKLPFALADLMISLDVSYIVMIMIIFVVYVILGSLMDPLAMVLLTVPIMLPTLTTLGFDLIWYGVFITIMTEMALITPPIGVNVFVVSGMVPQIPMYTIFKGIAPFILTMTVCLILLVIFPEIATILPDLMRGG